MGLHLWCTPTSQNRPPEPFPGWRLRFRHTGICSCFHFLNSLYDSDYNLLRAQRLLGPGNPDCIFARLQPRDGSDFQAGARALACFFSPLVPGRLAPRPRSRPLQLLSRPRHTGSRKAEWGSPTSFGYRRLQEMLRDQKPRSGLCSSGRGKPLKGVHGADLSLQCPSWALDKARANTVPATGCRLRLQAAHAAYSASAALAFHSCCSEKEEVRTVERRKKSRAGTQKREGRLELRWSRALEEYSPCF